MDNNIRVLLIDDDKTVRENLADHLSVVAGFEVTAYAKGAEALEHLENVEDNHYTAVLLDFVLDPFEMSGREVLKAINDQYTHLPVIVFTGKDPKGGLKAFGAGAYGYMQRPIDRTELINKIEALAEQDRLLREIARDIRQMLGSDVCLTWQRDKHTRQFHVAAWDGEVDTQYREKALLDLDEIAKRESLKQGKPLFVSDVTGLDNYPLPQLAEEQDWTSLISIPLIRQNQIIGLIDSYTGEEGYAFADDEDEKKRWLEVILPAFAHQAAEAVRNAELSRQRQTLQDINRVLGGSFEEDTVIHQILSKGLDLVGANFGWLYFVDASAEKIYAKDWIGIPDESVDKERAFREGITGWVAEQGETKNVPDVSADSQHKPIPGVKVASEIAVPLRREEQTIGVLTVKSQSRDAFTDDDEDLLLSLASQAVVVIERANLIRHLREVSALALAGDFQELADYILEAVYDLTGAEVTLWEISKAEERQDGVLQFVASKGGFSKRYGENAQLPTDPNETIAALALKRKAPIVIPDIFSDDYGDPEIPRFYNIQEAQQRGWRSFLTVPLLGREEEALGSLSLYSEERDKFGEPEVELMRTFANQAAIAIENARQQETQVKAIKEISGSIAASLDLEEVLDGILEWAVTLMGEASLGEVRMPDEEANELVVKAKRGKIIDDEHRRVPIGEGITGWVAKHKAVRYVPNVHYDDHYMEFLEGTQSEIAIPMLSKEGNLIGVLNIEHPEIDAFSENDRKLADAIANLAVVAIENVQTYEQLKRRRDELNLLNQAGKAFNSTRTPKEVLTTILEETSQLLEAESASTWLLVPNTDELICRQAIGPKSKGLVGYRLTSQEGIVGWTARTGESVYSPDTRTDERYFKGTNQQTGIEIRCVLSVPLTVKKGVIGVLQVVDTEPHHFNRTDLKLLESLASSAAIAIENARLFEQRKRKVNNLHALNDIGQYLTSSIELSEEQILDRIYQQATPLMDTDNMYIALYEPNPEQPDEDGASADRAIHGTVRFGLAMQYGRRVDTTSEEGWGPRQAGQGLTEYVIRTKKPYCPDDVEEAYNTIAEDYIDNLPESWLGVPMMVENQVLGVVVLRNEQEANVYDGDDLEVLQTIASQSAIALRNTRLVQDLRQTNEELEALRELQEDLSGPLAV
jgi:GAF domain-containing protein